MSGFMPSPALLHAVTEALALFKRHYARQMPLALEPTHEGNQFTEDFAKTLAGIAPEHIVAAAETWLAIDGSFPPKPGELRAVALKLQRFGSHVDAPTYGGPVPIAPRPDAERAGKQLLRIKNRIEEIEPRANAWAVAVQIRDGLVAKAHHPDIKTAWLNGLIPEHYIDAGIEEWQAGRKPVVVPVPEPASSFREWRHSNAIPRVKEGR